MRQRGGSRRGDPTEAAHSVGDVLCHVLHDGLVAVYLHGSGVLGGFRWDRSDLDVLALSRKVLADEDMRRVVAALVQLPYPANGLEFSLLTADDAARPDLPAPHFQLHLTTKGRTSEGKVVDGRGRSGDSDLVLHLAVCRARGLAVIGPPPETLVAAIPRGTILAAMRDEIDWARTHASLEYLVLTSARAWLFAETGRIASKIEAGLWAVRSYEEPGVVEAALACQRGSEAEIVPAEAARLATFVEGFMPGA